MHLVAEVKLAHRCDKRWLATARKVGNSNHRGETREDSYVQPRSQDLYPGLLSQGKGPGNEVVLYDKVGDARSSRIQIKDSGLT